ncbi:hypothetical protein GQ607_016648 [Colletotrichum asianum]|uniref:Uncharacterized protein n=1 Tax=Colletotrichum asianum TaxID=702518 RepID=A0A8H3VXE8_9PEZI|nr:hypothetical protein GQ607_016648 [Colletotrichum asianum]
MLAEATHTSRGGPKCPQFQVACCRLTCSSVKLQMLCRFSLSLFSLLFWKQSSLASGARNEPLSADTLLDSFLLVTTDCPPRR